MYFRSIARSMLLALILPLGITSTLSCGDRLTETCGLWCNSGDDKEASVGQEVLLNCEAHMRFCGYDDESILRYTWYQMGGTAVEMQNSDRQEASFTPTQTGKHVFSCVVTYPVTESNPEEETYPCASMEVTIN